MSDSTVEAPLHRLHLALVQALRERDPSGLGRPFTVAEIYQDLVPYRTHRDVLGVEMNGDYEHLVLRLLAGEDGLVSLGSEHARKEISEELGRSNPNTGLYREYAGVDVQLVAEHIPVEPDAPTEVIEESQASAPDLDEETHPRGLADMEFDEPDGEASVDEVVILPADAGEVATSVDDLAPAESDGAHDEDAAASVVEAGSELPGDDGVCYWCREQLPLRETLNFCPFCGIDVAVVPCPSCGEAIESNWRFCIQCGAPVGAA